VIAPRTPSGDAHLVAFVEPAPSRRAALAGQARDVLPNGLAIAHVHRHETDFLYAELFERCAYARHGVGLRDGAVVFDVGGNVGLFSLFAHLAARGVRVYAFEPHPRLCALLRANTAHYGADVRAFPVALGRTPGRAQFTYYSGLSYLSGLHPDPDKERALVRSHLAASGGALGAQQVAAAAHDFPDLVERLLDTRLAPETLDAEVRTLSDIVREQQIERIDLLKVNVERSELDVLLGIEEEHWPRIRQVAVEVEDSNGRLAAIRALLMRHGFRLTVEDDWSLAAASGIFYMYATRPEADLDDVPAAVTPTTDLTPWQPLDTREVSRFLERRLPAHMVPSRIIAIDRLPMSRHGKIDHAALAASVDTAAPAPLAADEPMTPIELAIARVWCDTLGIGRVGLDDAFFSVGGDSLQLVRVRARLLDAIGRLIPLVDLLQHRTIRSLAAYLAGSDRPRADGTGEPVAVARARTVERRRRWQSGGEVPPPAPGAAE
jgi:FkbM family methyltransferase